MFRKLIYLTCLVLVFATMAKAPDSNLVGWWKFDDVRVERRELEMERGETFLPKELFGFVKNSINNAESDLNGKFFKHN